MEERNGEEMRNGEMRNGDSHHSPMWIKIAQGAILYCSGSSPTL